MPATGREDAAAASMPILVKGRPNLHHILGAKIQEENVIKEKLQTAAWWASYRTSQDANYMARIGLKLEPTAFASSNRRPRTASFAASPLPTHGRNTSSQLDQHFSQTSELWELYSSGRSKMFSDRRNFKRKMPVYYGATLHAISRTGDDPSNRAH